MTQAERASKPAKARRLHTVGPWRIGRLRWLLAECYRNEGVLSQTVVSETVSREGAAKGPEASRIRVENQRLKEPGVRRLWPRR